TLRHEGSTKKFESLLSALVTSWLIKESLIMSASFIAILALFAQVGAGGAAPYRSADQPRIDANGDLVLSAASITAEEDSIIPAEAEGTLVKIAVKEGDRVSEGSVLATIDD